MRRSSAADAAPLNEPARFVRAARLVFALALASFVLSFVHRTAPAAIAGELTQAFSISAAVLGTLAATYFYVYTVLQIPVGVLADTLGPRRILTVGSAVAAAGSLLFALAPAWEIAAVGRTLVGIGVSVAFIAVLKVSSVWFPPERFATLTGVTMFAGNLGAVAAGAPLAWAVTLTSWRVVFVAIAVLSGLLALATWLRVRDSPQELGFAPVTGAVPAAARVPWLPALARVLANRSTWPAFIANAGVGGSYLAFAGLWSVPYLTDAHGMSRTLATTHTTTMLVVFALSSLAAGSLSDRMGRRRPLLVALGAVHVLCWIPLLWAFPGSRAGSIALFAAIGASATAFTLSWASAKEVNPPALSGMAMSIVNTGVFLGPTLTQPLVGWVIERGVAGGAGGGRGGAADYRLGLGVLAAFSLVGLASALFVRETFCRNVTVDPSPEGAAGDR
jgi:MFS family permease